MPNTHCPGPVLCLLATFLAAATVAAADDPARAGYWIWHQSAAASHGVPAGAAVFLRRHLEVAEPVAEAWLSISADDAYELCVNGQRVGSGENWAQPERYALAPLLSTGDNVIAVKASNNLAGPAGVFFAGRVTYRSGKSLDFASDKETLAAVTASQGWEQVGADETAFSPARELAPRFGGPWGGGGGPLDVAATVAAWQKEWQRLFAAQSTLPEPVLIPRPKHLTWQGAYLSFVAQGKGLVRFATPRGGQAEHCAEFLRSAAGWLSGQAVSWQPAGTGPVVALSLDRRAVGAEAYAIRWDARSQTLHLTAATDRGLTWGTYTLAQLLVKRGDGVALKLANIGDAPAVPMRGIVTGVPLEMLPWAAYYRYNVNGISVGLAEAVTAEHGRLRREARRLGVDLVLFNHPPQEFAYSDEQGVGAYCELIRQAARQGFRYFSLDVDDFPDETVTEEDIAKYGKGLVALGRGQTDLVRRLDAAAAGRLHLIFCPRVYYDSTRVGPTPRPAPPEELAYRALVAKLPADISIWTTQPKLPYLRELNAVYQRKPLVWHNYWLDFSQCGEFYFLPYPTLTQDYTDLAEGYWAEQDMVGNPGRANYLIHAATLWNPSGRPTWTEVFAREYGIAAAEGLARYARLTGCGDKAQGVMADWWDQPPSHPGVALGTTDGGQLPTLQASGGSVAALRQRAAEAREAMGVPLDGVDEPTQKLLRENAEKIALNYELYAARLGLSWVPVAGRAQSLDAMRPAVDRLETLGASKGYLTAWRQWLAEAGRG
jgi:hypothetical protein